MTETKKWQDIVKLLKDDAFPSPWQNKESLFTQYVTKIAELEDSMRFEYDSLIPYVVYGSHNGVKGQGAVNYVDASKATVPETHSDLDAVSKSLVSSLYSSAYNPTHPFTIFNVVPAPSIASVLGSMLAAKLNPNVIDGFSGIHTSRAEVEVASMLIRMLGQNNGKYQWPDPWEPKPVPVNDYYRVTGLGDIGNKSGGIATFGGTGCYLYAIKYALTKVANSVLPEGETVRATGINGNGKFVILVSNQGHYCSNNVTDWLGIGYEQVISLRTNQVDNSTDLDDLKLKLNKCKTEGKIVVAVVPTFGTTDAGALDDVKSIREIVDAFDNIVDPVTNKRYGKPFIYADSVTGWIWSFFIDYNFSQNPLGFDEAVKNRIQKNAELVKGLTTTDAFGIDFHKTGYSPYPASMVVFKNYGDFAQLMSRPSSPYLQQERYDPGLYTLETSRSSMGYVSAWANFKHLGIDGLRSLTYNLIAHIEVLREKLRRTGYIVLCNESNTFYSTLLRIYPFRYTPEQYECELTDEKLYEDFVNWNAFQKNVYNVLLRNLRYNDGSAELLSTPIVSLTTGFRYTYYNPDGDKQFEGQPMQGVFALKCYLNTPFVDEDYFQTIIEHLDLARNEVSKATIPKSIEFKMTDKLIYPELPKGVHPYNNLVPADYIPIKSLLPATFDYVGDSDYKLEIEKLEKRIEELRLKIRKDVTSKKLKK